MIFINYNQISARNPKKSSESFACPVKCEERLLLPEDVFYWALNVHCSVAVHIPLSFVS